jgi:hypothetical protein
MRFPQRKFTDRVVKGLTARVQRRTKLLIERMRDPYMSAAGGREGIGGASNFSVCE